MSQRTEFSQQPPAAAAAADPGGMPGLSKARAFAAVIILVLAGEVGTFQTSMISVILPKIGASLPGSGDSTSWALTIITLVGGATFVLIGKLADRYGKKKLILLCAASFVVGSALDATTHSWAIFLVGRALQALALGITALSFGLVRDVLPKKWVPTAVALIATGFGVGAIAAPMLTAALTDSFSWRSVFVFLGCYIGVLLVAAVFVVPETPVRHLVPIDLLGAALIGTTTGSILLYVSEGTTWGWHSTRDLTWLAIGVVAGTAFFVWQSHAQHPLIDPKLLRRSSVSLTLGCMMMANAVFAVVSFVPPYMFEVDGSAVKRQIVGDASAKAHVPVSMMQRISFFRGDIFEGKPFSITDMAVRLSLWIGIAIVIFGLLSGVWARKRNPREPMVVGMALLLLSSLALAVWHSTWQEQLVFLVVAGAAAGLCYAAGPNLILEGVPQDRQGVSASMLNLGASLGAGLGLAFATSVLAAHQLQFVVHPTGGKEIVTEIPQVFDNTGYTLCYLLVAVVASGIGFVFGTILVTRRRSATPSV